MIQDLSGSWCIKGTGESITRVDSPVPLMHHDPDRSWITDPDPDHPKGTQPFALCYVHVFRLLWATAAHFGYASGEPGEKKSKGAFLQKNPRLDS